MRNSLYTIGHTGVMAYERPIYCPSMDWKAVRSAFIGTRERLNLTQVMVAAKGKLPQSAISKLESNDKLGPAVEVLLRAIAGLGVSVSGFFLHVEQIQRSSGNNTKVPLLTEDPRIHNAASSGTQGVVDALSATLDQARDTDLHDAARLALARALTEAAARLMSPGTAAPE